MREKAVPVVESCRPDGAAEPKEPLSLSKWMWVGSVLFIFPWGGGPIRMVWCVERFLCTVASCSWMASGQRNTAV